MRIVFIQHLTFTSRWKSQWFFLLRRRVPIHRPRRYGGFGWPGWDSKQERWLKVRMCVGFSLDCATARLVLGEGGGGEILCGSANSFNCYEIIDAFSRPHQMLELEVLSLIGKLNNARMSRAADRIRWKAIRLTSICETHNRIFRPWMRFSMQLHLSPTTLKAMLLDERHQPPPPPRTQRSLVHCFSF